MFGPVDAKAAFPMALFFFHWAMSTFYIALVGTALFGVLSYFGISPMVGVRRTVRRIMGRRRNREYAVTFRRRVRSGG